MYEKYTDNMAKKIKRKLKRKFKYANGGMYNNTIPAGLTTTNIVAQESNPEIQKQREESLVSTTEDLLNKSTELSSNIKDQEIQDNQTVANEALLQEQNAQMPDQIVGTGIDATQKIGTLLADRTTKKTSEMLAKQAAHKGKEIVIDKTKDVTTKALGYKTTSELAQQKLVEEGAKRVGEETTKQVAGQVGSQVATKSFNPSPYALAANVVGTGIGLAADDQDPTTWTFGEASGDVLAEAGEWAGYGATIGSFGGPLAPVTATAGAIVGGIIGIGKGLYEGFTKRKKARRRAKELKRERDQKVQTYNKDFNERFGTQMSNVRAGNIKQKTKYGYDLGVNTTARMGGLRLGIPRY